jgi:pSer/pThr/pTyr-binding forkhead associated (FHA) protein
MALSPLPVHTLFTLLRESLDKAGEALGATHALVPLEPWLMDPEGVEDMTGTVTLTGRGHLVATAAGRQVPVLRAQAYPLRGASLSIGRTSKADLVIDQPTVSRIHAEILLRDDGYCVSDRGSYNGTMLNNRVLDPNEVAALSDGDVVVFGEAQTVFGSLPHLAALIGGKGRGSKLG